MCFRICQMCSHFSYTCCALPGLCWPSQLFIPNFKLSEIHSSSVVMEWRIIITHLWKKKTMKKETMFCVCPRSCFLIQSVPFICVSTVYPWAAAPDSSQTSFLMILFPSSSHLGANASQTTESEQKLYNIWSNLDSKCLAWIHFCISL